MRLAVMEAVRAGAGEPAPGSKTGAKTRDGTIVPEVLSAAQPGLDLRAGSP